MSQEQIWILLSKKMAGEASAQELGALEELIRTHPEWQYAVQNLEDLWKLEPRKDELQSEDAWLLHLHRMEEQKQFESLNSLSSRRAIRMRWFRLAAAVLVLAVLTGLGYRYYTHKGKETLTARAVNEITTRPGSKSKVELPDGTVVWLNAGSKLTYDKNYNTELREVNLTGEGYFDVVKNKEKPFIIHTSAINIKVLGTVFNVKAYPQDKRTETSLIRGSIEVTMKNRPNDKIILSPNEKLVVENEQVMEKPAELRKTVSQPEFNTLVSVNKLKYATADSALVETAWISNRLIFRDESFEELAVRMERWYDVEIAINDEALQQKRVSGTFKDENVEQALEALKIFIPFHYEMNGKKIIIHR